MRILYLFVLFIIMPYSFASPSQTLVYTDINSSNYAASTHRTISLLKQHDHKIAILAPQAYEVSKKGNITGSLDAHIFKLANAEHIKIMPLIYTFNSHTIHTLLNNETAQTRMIDTIIMIGKKNHYYGFQFDLEPIANKDRNAYTAFIRKAAVAMHKNGLKLSLAILAEPQTARIYTSQQAFMHSFHKGTYNFKELAKYVDFLSVMTYDQHTSTTSPGPIASLPWVKAIITNLLKVVPANKLSLGIPAYSGLWVTQSRKNHFRSVRVALNYQQVRDLIKKYNLKLQWNEKTQVAFAVYTHQRLHEYLFAENARAFKAKLDLANRYHLRSISIWKLGMEDPKIWAMLPHSIS